MRRRRPYSYQHSGCSHVYAASCRHGNAATGPAVADANLPYGDSHTARDADPDGDSGSVADGAAHALGRALTDCDRRTDPADPADTNDSGDASGGDRYAVAGGHAVALTYVNTDAYTASYAHSYQHPGGHYHRGADSGVRLWPQSTDRASGDDGRVDQPRQCAPHCDIRHWERAEQPRARPERHLQSHFRHIRNIPLPLRYSSLHNRNGDRPELMPPIPRTW